MVLYTLKKNNHPHPTLLSDFILGSQDGLVNVLGILLGVAAATSDIRILFVAGLAALGAESISMGAVAYTSTLARHRYYLKAVEKEQNELKNSAHKKGEIKRILKGWGYAGKELEELTKSIAGNSKATLDFMMSFEHHLAPVDRSAPLRSFFVVLSATIFGSVIPLLPFLFTHNILLGAIGAVILSGITLFVIGYYEAKITVGSLWLSGLQMLAIGLVAGFAGYLIGHYVGGVPV